MQFSKIAVATATSAALALSTITAPAAVANDSEAPRGGSAMWTYDAIMTGTMDAVATSHRPGSHPTENFGLDLILVAPVALLMLPLQKLAEAEVHLSSQFGV